MPPTLVAVALEISKILVQSPTITVVTLCCKDNPILVANVLSAVIIVPHVPIS